MMNNPQQMRRFVFVRDRGICRSCGKDCYPPDAISRQIVIDEIMHALHKGETALAMVKRRLGDWQVDHKEPLFLADGNIWYWSLENTQTLCPECHVIKTKEDSLRLTKDHS